MAKKPVGWRKEPGRHSLAAKGVKTATVRGVTYREDSGVMMEPLLKVEMEDSVVAKINAIRVPAQDKRTHQALDRAVHHVRDGNYDEALEELLTGTLQTGSVPTRTKIMDVFGEIKAYHTGQMAKWPRED